MDDDDLFMSLDVDQLVAQHRLQQASRGGGTTDENSFSGSGTSNVHHWPVESGRRESGARSMVIDARGCTLNPAGNSNQAYAHPGPGHNGVGSSPSAHHDLWPDRLEYQKENIACRGWSDSPVAAGSSVSNQPNLGHANANTGNRSWPSSTSSYGDGEQADWNRGTRIYDAYLAPGGGQSHAYDHDDYNGPGGGKAQAYDGYSGPLQGSSSSKGPSYDGCSGPFQGSSRAMVPDNASYAPQYTSGPSAPLEPAGGGEGGYAQVVRERMNR